MNKGDIVIYKRKNGKKALGKVADIDGINILLLNIVDSDLNKLCGKFGSGNTTIVENDILDVIRL